MTLAMIALTFSLIALVINIAVIVKRNRDSEQEKAISYVNRKVNDLTEMVQPLFDKHRKEQEQKLIEVRKKHWKSFNTWKFHKGMFEKDEDNIVCPSCFCDSLELKINYKLGTGEACFAENGGIEYLKVDNDYPITAEHKCTVCGHVSDKWECE